MSVSFFEIGQTLLAFIGALMTLWVKKDADRTRNAVRRFKFNGEHILIADKNCRVENAILLVQAVFFFAGLWAIYLAPPPFPRGVDADQQRVMREIAGSIIIVRTAMAAASFWLMQLSYRNWVQLRPVRARREEDESQDSSSAPRLLAKVAEVAADASEHAAGVSREVADKAAEEAEKAKE